MIYDSRTADWRMKKWHSTCNRLYFEGRYIPSTNKHTVERVMIQQITTLCARTNTQLKTIVKWNESCESVPVHIPSTNKRTNLKTTVQWVMIQSIATLCPRTNTQLNTTGNESSERVPLYVPSHPRTNTQLKTTLEWVTWECASKHPIHEPTHSWKQQ